MAPPTVRDVWRLALPTAVRLAGGEAGLGNPVLWARRMAVHPPAFAALQEGDIECAIGVHYIGSRMIPVAC